MKNEKRRFAIFALAVTLLSAYFCMTGTTRTVNDSLIRVLTAGTLVFILSGAMLHAFFGQRLNLRTQSFLGFFAISGFLSFVLLTTLAVACFTFQLPIGFAAATLILSNLFASIYLLFFPRRAPAFAAIVIDSVDRLWLAAITVFSVLLLFKADSIQQVGWELSLHLQYVRHYASDLPLSFYDSVLRPGELVPGNHFFLWEFALASVSKIAGVDVLIASLRTRWIIPVIGFSGLYFLAETLTSSRRVAQMVCGIGLMMTILQFQFVEPFRWMNAVISGPFRGITMFLGSVHHSDVAMEVLMPIALALLFRMFWRPRLWSVVLFILSQVLMFFWHPREFFQVAWIATIAVLAHVLTSPRARAFISLRKRYVPVMGSFIFSAALLFSIGLAIGGVPQEQAHAFASKKEVFAEMIAQAQTWGFWSQAQSLFLYYEQAIPKTSGTVGTSTFCWLVLAGLMLIPCLCSNRRRTRWFGVFFLLLWFLTLSYSPSQWFLTLATYDEILMSKSRFLFPFFIIAIALGWIEMAESYFRPPIPRLRYANYSLILGCLAAGGIYFALWRSFLAYPFLAYLIATLLFAAFIIALYKSHWGGASRSIGTVNSFRTLPVVLLFGLFLLPVTWTTFTVFYREKAFKNESVTSLFSEDNPVGLSLELIAFLQNQIPARSYIQVEPNRERMIGVYAPVYVRPLSGYVIKDLAEHALAREDKHPLFNSELKRGDYDIEQIIQAVNSKQIDYLFAEADFVFAYRKLTHDHPELFSEVFHSKNGRELILKVHRRTR